MRVRNRKPNASTLINGVRFAPDPDGGGMVSEPVDDEQAAHFLAVPGYERVDEAETSVEGPGLPGDLSTLPVGDIERLLADQPHLAGRVLADEQAARGDKARKGVLEAVEAARSSESDPEPGAE